MRLLLIAFATALTAQPTLGPAAEAQRAQELVAAGKPEEAARIYRHLLRGAPDNAALLLNLCIAEYKASQFAEAAAHAEAAVKLQPELLPARLFLGASLFELGEFKRAVEPLEGIERMRAERIVRASSVRRAPPAELVAADAARVARRPDERLASGLSGVL